MTEFSDLLGLHTLSGLETSVEKLSDFGYGYDDAMVVYVVIDGKTYRIQEDPSDGYRSSMGSFGVDTEYKVKNTFPPQQMFVTMRSDDTWRKNDTLEFTDVETLKLVLALGTDNTDDWYPYFVFEWNPENMAINIEASEAEDESGLIGVEHAGE